MCCYKYFKGIGECSKIQFGKNTNASTAGLFLEFQKPDVSEVVCQEIANSSLTVECSKLCQVNLRPKDCKHLERKERLVCNGH